MTAAGEWPEPTHPGAGGIAGHERSSPVSARLTARIVVLALAGGVASVAPGGTIGRLIVPTTFALAVLALARHHSTRNPGASTWIAVSAFWLVSWLHILFTSAAAAWAIDSHMVPWVPMPGSAARVVIAWSAPLCWTAFVALAAARIHRAAARPAVTALLIVAAVLPLLNPDGFPVDGYELLWNRSAFSHPTYTTAILAFAAAATLLANRPTEPTKTETRPHGEAMD